MVRFIPFAIMTGIALIGLLSKIVNINSGDNERQIKFGLLLFGSTYSNYSNRRLFN